MAKVLFQRLLVFSVLLFVPFLMSAHYYIVTTQATVQNSEYFMKFVASKYHQGHSVHVVYEGDHYYYNGTSLQLFSSDLVGWKESNLTATGDTAAILLRSWLRTNMGTQLRYAANHMEYILLVGNPDPTTGSVPMKKIIDCGESGEGYCATDYYYADLDQAWTTLEGSVDYSPEVMVGRIPVYGSDMYGLDKILNRIITYENTKSNRIGWRKNVFIPTAARNEADSWVTFGEGYHTEGGSTATFDGIIEQLEAGPYQHVSAINKDKYPTIPFYFRYYQDYPYETNQGSANYSKAINYSDFPDNDYIEPCVNDNYAQRALLPVEALDYECDTVCCKDEADLLGVTKGTHTISMDGDKNNNYLNNMNNIFRIMTSYEFGVVAWATHGGVTTADQIMSTAEYSRQLSGERPPILFQGSCLNAYPDVNDILGTMFNTNANNYNLAYSMLRNYAVTTIAATRSGGDPNIATKFVPKLVNEQSTIGVAWKYAIANWPLLNKEGLVITNIYGDPSIRISSSALSGDADTDNDAVVDLFDNCPTVPNPSQTDTDNDGIGDPCETTVTATYGMTALGESTTPPFTNVTNIASGYIGGWAFDYANVVRVPVDLNNDGKDEFIMTSPWGMGLFGVNSSGQYYLMEGNQYQTNTTDWFKETGARFVATGNFANFNGANKEILVLSPRGLSIIYWDSATSKLVTYRKVAYNAQIPGVSSGWWNLGTQDMAVALTGDLDGDGYDDFILRNNNWGIGFFGIKSNAVKELAGYAWGSQISTWVLRRTDRIVAIGNFTADNSKEIALQSNTYLGMLDFIQSTWSLSLLNKVSGQIDGTTGWTYRAADQVIGMGRFMTTYDALIIKSYWGLGFLYRNSSGAMKLLKKYAWNTSLNSWVIEPSDELKGVADTNGDGLDELVLWNSKQNSKGLGLIAYVYGGNFAKINGLYDSMPSFIGAWRYYDDNEVVGVGNFSGNGVANILIKSHDY